METLGTSPMGDCVERQKFHHLQEVSGDHDKENGHLH